MSDTTMNDFYRICVKLYGPEPTWPGSEADALVPVFHDWIRERAFDMVLFDVADYAHVPDGPGIMLVTHEAAFGLDRSDGRFGLFAQRRVRFPGDAASAIETTVRQTLEVATRLQSDSRLEGKLHFDTTSIRLEANDRLKLPNSDEGFADFEVIARQAIGRIAGADFEVHRVQNDPRDRLAIDVLLPGAPRSAGSRAA